MSAAPLTPEERAALFRPTPVARGLPGRAYTDPQFWALEKTRLFARRWVACGYDRDVPNPGDARPVRLADWELILTRDESGRVNVLHNVCSHRGMRVLDKPCSGARQLRCPYHRWTYDLRGALVATPNLGGIHVNEVEGFEREELGLKAVRTDTWLGWVFINLDGQAPPLERFLAPLHERIAAYDLSLLGESGIYTEDLFAGNWKIAVEGGIEDYHVPWVHPQLGPHAGTFTPEHDDEDCYVGFSSRAPAETERRGAKEVDREAVLPRFPNVERESPPPGLGPEGLILMVPPSMVLAIMPNHVVTTTLHPESIDRTWQRRVFHFIGEAATATDAAPMRAAVRDTWLDVGAQDRPFAETLQRQHAQRDALGMPTRFSPHWEPAVHHFQKMVVRLIER